MALPFEQALQTLQSMFPSVDLDIIVSLLHDTGGHMERTCDMLLQLTTDVPTSEANTEPTIAVETGPTVAPVTIPAPRETIPMEAKPIVESNGGSGSAILPDDFLRVPGGWPRDSKVQQLIEDELLAQMLQDQMFMEEVQNNDPQFLRAVAVSQAEANHGRVLSPTTETRPAGSAVGDSSFSDKVSNAGSNAKRKMISLWQRFKSKKKTRTPPSGDYQPLMATRLTDDMDEDDSFYRQQTPAVGERTRDGGETELIDFTARGTEKRD
eukprot:TRINITY_DN2125_c1_g1_i3.p1 TRINITY_DN2125_c1_g1~~TRINITY_DN2125_c1_g1_i3.p1  ORF type:complete len:267 (-),score=94.55 TRINITY_DN2125_c1_g1_i3:969-1769(-)